VPSEPVNSLKVSVVDSGIGIKLKDQDKLFKLFGSIKNEKKKINVKGIGLGLAISKLIVHKFNGIIDFISKYKKGSTFYFTFQLEMFDKSEFLLNEHFKDNNIILADTGSI
jgi:signal transduction histidine kinase